MKDSEYKLGFVEAEQRNPLTLSLGENYKNDTLSGVKTLISADAALEPLYRRTLKSSEFNELCDEVFETLLNGGRIIISGCGSSGRLAMRIEASWREAVAHTAFRGLSESVISLMTGGDYALIRAVESFEDHIDWGYAQAAHLKITPRDILIGVTATGETTSILGTAQNAIASGARVRMVVCTDPSTLLGKLERADKVYTSPLCRSLYIPCGGMAVTGSTRMQSSTVEQAVISSALELALDRMCGDTVRLDDGFASALDAINAQDIARLTDTETALYKANGHVTYFADEFLLDVLADTTERGPTFCVPPFRPRTNTSEPLSWAFVKNPYMPTRDAWLNCFGRKPRCIESSDRITLGIPNDARIPDIGLDALMRFEIGCEADPEREQGESLAIWIGGGAPHGFSFAKKYKCRDAFLLNTHVLPTRMKIFEHVSAKMSINTFSTGVMAKMGRICGNYMVCMNISNKKLIDRAGRMISVLCGISYEKAIEELFFTKLLFERDGIGDSPVKGTVDRIGMRKDQNGYTAL